MKRLLALPLAALLAACAPLPPEQQSVAPRTDVTVDKTIQGLAQKTQPAAQAQQSERWWEALHDPQLNQLIETALQHSPDLQVLQARVAAAGQAEQLARLNGQVHYDTNASVIRQRYSENGIFPPPIGGSVFTQDDISLGMSYTLDFWGKNRALVKAAVGEARAAQAEQAAARLNLAALVADAWYAWGDAQSQLRLAEQQVALQQKQVEVAETRFRHGLDTALPGLAARQALQRQQDGLQQLTYQTRADRYRLAALLGLSPDQSDSLPEPQETPALLPLPAHVPADWLAQRPDVQAQLWRVQAAQGQVDASKADFYPNIDLKLLVGLESIDASKWLTPSSRMGSVGPAIHLPLLNVQTLRARLGQSQADYRAAVASYDATLLQAARQAVDSYALASSLDQRSKMQQAAMDEAEKTRAVQALRLQKGLIAETQLLDAEQAALSQQQQLVTTRTARMRAQVALMQAVGGRAFRSEP